MPNATRRAHAAGAGDELQARINSYRPRAIESASWSAVRPFVLECAARLPAQRLGQHGSDSSDARPVGRLG